ncbi:MAG: hypothetical protein H7A24_11400 [Leptospiraceae bacterium]|nr:hypothetical protein [Leptospiraceae bacterium]MCP5512479.1 hypothetical protein [Leptospiraceae bacterium]
MKLPFLFLLVFLSIFPGFASEVIESQYSIEDTNLRITKLLNHITDDSIRLEDKTRGFNYHYTPRWYTPFRFNLYIGKFSKNYEGAIIRIEAPRKGETKVFRSIIEQELEIASEITNSEKKFEPIQTKSHAVSLSLNFISPAFSVWYSGHHSPFYQTWEMLGKMGLYFVIDVVIVGLFALYAQNTRRSKDLLDKLLWRKGPDDLDLAHGKYSSALLVALTIPRLYRMSESFSEIGTQNRLAELSYSIDF